MKTILTPDSKDACSFYRGLGPLGRLHQQGLINLKVSRELDWTHVSQADLVFILRPEGPWHLTLAKLASNWGVPVWVDMDDDLFSVPEDNPSYAHYKRESTRKIIRECLSIAEFSTASTELLANVMLSEGARRVVVVPNALDPRFQQKPEGARKKIILWRGSKTHERDLHEYTPAILSAARENPGWHWHFQGCNPWRLTEPLKAFGGVSTADSLSIEEYMGFISELSPAIMIVPLADNALNRSKSNIAWIEATYARAATLAPAWPEWERPGVTNYTSPDSFRFRLTKLMDRGATASKESADYISEHLRLDHVNKKRLELIEGLK